MNHFSSSIVFMLFIALFLSACSESAVVASYFDGKKEQRITVRDIKKDILEFSIYEPELTNDSSLQLHKNYVNYHFITPRIVGIEESASGIASRADYQSSYILQYQQQKLVNMNAYGESLIKKKLLEGKLVVARASHIILLTRKTAPGSTPGKERFLTAAEYNKLVSEKLAAAEKIISDLKSSKNQLSDFSNTAAKLSDDQGSAQSGGDLGYFTTGLMDRKFEDTVFSAKTKGLIDKPVQNDYGIQIVYVTSPKQEKSLDEIKSMAGENKYISLKNYVQNAYYDMEVLKNYRGLFSVNTNEKTLTILNRNYPVNKIPENAVLFELYGKSYTWSDSSNLLSVLAPDFITNLDSGSFSNFLAQMDNLKYFLPAVETARKAGYDKTSRYQKDMELSTEYIKNKIAFQIFNDDIRSKAAIKREPSELLNFYNNNKEKFMKTVNGKKVPMSFAESREAVNNEMDAENYQSLYENWMKNAIVKYRIRFYDDGLKKLIPLETDYLAELRLKLSGNRPLR
jgi:hypothetical protein